MPVEPVLTDAVRLRIPPEVVSQKLGADVVLLHLGTGVYWSLNETGAAIWEALQQHGKIPETVEILQARYAAPAADLRAAARSLVKNLLREGLLEAAR